MSNQNNQNEQINRQQSNQNRTRRFYNFAGRRNNNIEEQAGPRLVDIPQIPMPVFQLPNAGVIEQPIDPRDQRVSALEAFNRLAIRAPLPRRPAITDEERAACRLGAYDTPEFRSYAFPSFNPAAALVLKNINSHMFSRELINLRNYGVITKIALMVRHGRCLSSGIPPNKYALCFGVLETIAPELPDTVFLPQLEARRSFIKYICTYLGHHGIARGVLGIQNIELNNFALPEEESPVAYNVGANNRILSNQILRRLITTEAGGDMNSFLAGILRLPAGNKFDLNGATDQWITALTYSLITALTDLFPFCSTKTPLATQMYATLYVALGKRGHASDKIGKLQEQLTSEIGSNVTLDSEIFNILYKAIQPHLIPNRIESLFSILGNNFAQVSLRLQLLMQQSIGSGLTSYTAVSNVIKLFQDFEWNVICMLFPDEITKFGEAMTLIGTNQFFGFSNDLGPARSTNYKNLTYIAMQLLIQHRGREYNSLTKYAGLIRRPDKFDRVRELLDNYNPVEVMDDLLGNAADIVGQARAMLLG